MAETKKTARGLDDFSDRERATQERFAKFRTRFFGPWIRPLSRLGVSADHITLCGALLLAPFAFFFESSPRLATLILAIYVILDGLDGAYARITNTANEGGAFTDTVADQLGMIVVSLLAIHHQLVNPTLAAYYVAIYVAMIVFAVVQNYIGLHSPLTIRSKYPLYVAYAIWAFTGGLGEGRLELFHWIMAVFSVPMTVSVLMAFFALKKHFASQSGPDSLQ